MTTTIFCVKEERIATRMLARLVASIHPHNFEKQWKRFVEALKNEN